MSKLIILLIIFLLIIFLIYLIYNHLKKTEEHFNSIIEVHVDDSDRQYHLCKLDLQDDDNLMISSVKPNILVKNIIALYPIDNDIVYLLDSIHDLYKVEFTDSNITTIKISGNISGYPIKLVGNANHIYILSSNGYIFKIDNDEYQPPDYISNVIDIALCGNQLFYINKEGQLFSYSNKTILVDDEYFIQIIGSGPEYLFGLTPAKKIKKINVFASAIDANFDHTVDTINIKLISSNQMFGYITNSNNFYYMLNADNEIIPMHFHSNVKDAMFSGINAVVGQEDISTYHRRIILRIDGNFSMSDYSAFGNLTAKQIINGGGHLRSNSIFLFGGVNANNIFVLINGDIEILPPSATPIDFTGHDINTEITCPSNSCDLCEDATYDLTCESIYLRIASLINGSGLCADEDPTIVETVSFYKYEGQCSDWLISQNYVIDDLNEDGDDLANRLKKCHDEPNCGYYEFNTRENRHYFISSSLTPLPIEQRPNIAPKYTLYSKTIIPEIGNPPTIVELEILSDGTNRINTNTKTLSMFEFYEYFGHEDSTVSNELNGSVEENIKNCALDISCDSFYMDDNLGNIENIGDGGTSQSKTRRRYFYKNSPISDKIPTKYYKIYLDNSSSNDTLYFQELIRTGELCNNTPINSCLQYNSSWCIHNCYDYNTNTLCSSSDYIKASDCYSIKGVNQCFHKNNTIDPKCKNINKTYTESSSNSFIIGDDGTDCPPGQHLTETECLDIVYPWTQIQSFDGNNSNRNSHDIHRIWQTSSGENFRPKCYIYKGGVDDNALSWNSDGGNQQFPNTGLDILPICKSSPPTEPHVCASTEGETCKCNGTVYYGRKLTENTSGDPVSFDQMIADDHNTTDVTNEITCSEVGGTDPLYGVFKQCWCVPNIT